MEAPLTLLHRPAVLRPLAQGAVTLRVRALTVEQALASVAAEHPSLAGAIRSEDGAIRPHVSLFVNSEHIRSKEGTATALRDGDAIIILPSISVG